MGDSYDGRDNKFSKEVYANDCRAKLLHSSKRNKRAWGGRDSEQDGEEHDCIVVPTDFTGEEIEVLEAKLKAIERNHRRKKEQEFIRNICEESGHFTQMFNKAM